MSNYTSTLDYEISVLLRESGYQGRDMTYGAALDWLADYGVLVVVEPAREMYQARINRRRSGFLRDTWREAANDGIKKGFGIISRFRV